ncbi:MAG: hypothetical protein M3146_02535 [Thermoproteota archaeon]|nr:hypothetical protein [Thermoproteota archaeon]
MNIFSHNIGEEVGSIYLLDCFHNVYQETPTLGRDDGSTLPSRGAHHSNPLCRITPVNDKERVNLRYDKEKYREMLLDAAQSVLGYFGFDRTVYGDKINTTPRKWRWLQELKQQREKDIKTEIM